MQSIFIKNRRNHTNYTTAWEQRELSDLIIEYKETVDSECDLPVLTSSKTEGVVLQEEHFGRKQQHDITGYNILPRGYCTYRNRSDGVDFTFNINKCCDKGIISKFYPVFYGNNSDVFFISLVLNHSKEVVHEIGYTCTGTGQKGNFEGEDPVTIKDVYTFSPVGSSPCQTYNGTIISTGE